MAIDRVAVQPELLRWACERAGRSLSSLAKKFPKLALWVRGEAQPTLKQLESFAKATYTPVGYLFLSQPPEEEIPIPDFRTVQTKAIQRPSPNLLDTLYLCQERQAWYRDHARSLGEEPLPFVGSVGLTSDIVATAASIRHVLGFDLEERRRMGTWEKALRQLIAQVDAVGVLVMVSGIVASNTRRTLDPEEFRGFVLVDDLAPLIFLNGADTKSAQMFTLAHELAHVWLGRSALSDSQAAWIPEHDVERWCNQVAAELLVPLNVLQERYRPDALLDEEMQRLARVFKVSTLVILRRIHDAGGLGREAFWQAYRGELDRLLAVSKKSGGGFYRTLKVRVGDRFARALVASTLEGQTLYRDAYRMLGFSSNATFQKLTQRLGLGEA